MNEVRFGVVGLGNIGLRHASCLRDGKVPGAKLTAVCSRNPSSLTEPGSLAVFSEVTALIRAGVVDAVLLATPHPAHVDPALAALDAGLHVLVEKPLAAHIRDAERMIAAHRGRERQMFGVMFQLRAEPRYQHIRQLLNQGELGELLRVNWISTDWFRPEAYFASSAWRATWKGEGGGVLLNQALHPLDMLQWLVGMPRRVRAVCQFGRHHRIEVEDDVTAILEWDNGMTGTFIASTGEAPGTNRLEICGTLGKLVLERDQLTLTRNVQDSRVFNREATGPFERLAHDTQSLSFEAPLNAHAAMLQNFVAAIQRSEPLLAPAPEALGSVELSNAMVLSSLRNAAVELPMNGEEWETRLNELVATSTHQKRVQPTGPADVEATFRR